MNNITVDKLISLSDTLDDLAEIIYGYENGLTDTTLNELLTKIKQCIKKSEKSISDIIWDSSGISKP